MRTVEEFEVEPPHGFPARIRITVVAASERVFRSFSPEIVLSDDALIAPVIEVSGERFENAFPEQAP